MSLPTAAALLATAGAALVVAAPAAADPAVDGELPLSTTPGQLTLGPDGNVWIALDGVAKDLARVAPDGTVTEFETTNVTNPVGIAAGPDGNLWVTQAGGVARVAPASPTTATAFPVADIADPRGIAAGPDGNLWTGSGDKAIRITPAGDATSFTVPGMAARGIATGGDGRLYLADFGGQRIVALTTAGVPTFFPTGGGPQAVAAGAGADVAFTDPGAMPQVVGRLGAAPAVLTTPVPGTDPFGIALGGDGAHWAANFATSTLTRFDAAGQVTTLAGLSAGSGPRWIAAGAGGTLWVSLETAQKVARVTGVEPPPPLPPSPEPPTPLPDPLPQPPVLDTITPTASVVRAPRRLRAGRTRRLVLTLSEPATVTLRFVRRGRAAGARTVDGVAGRNVVRLGARAAGRRLRPGRYRLVVVARDDAGNRARVRAGRVTVLPRRRAS